MKILFSGLRISLIIIFAVLQIKCKVNIIHEIPKIPNLKAIEFGSFNDFITTLNYEFESHGVLLDSNSPFTLEINTEHLSESINQVASDGQVRELIISFHVKYQLKHNNRVFFPAKTIHIQKTIFINNQDILSSEKDKLQLISNTYKSAAQQIYIDLANQFSVKHKVLVE